MNEEIRKFLNNETYILAYRSNYDSAREVNQKLIDYVNDLQKQNAELKELIDTILTFNLFGEECPLDFGFEKDSLQEKAQETFYENDGEYCENNCNECYKKCWLRFFNKIKELRGDKNV